MDWRQSLRTLWKVRRNSHSDLDDIMTSCSLGTISRSAKFTYWSGGGRASDEIRWEDKIKWKGRNYKRAGMSLESKEVTTASKSKRWMFFLMFVHQMSNPKRWHLANLFDSYKQSGWRVLHQEAEFLPLLTIPKCGLFWWRRVRCSRWTTTKWFRIRTISDIQQLSGGPSHSNIFGTTFSRKYGRAPSDQWLLNRLFEAF